MTKAHQVYFGSHGGQTRSFCSKLRKQGCIGRIASALFLAQKSSTRAKAYRGSIPCGDGRSLRYADLAYERKDKSLQNLVHLLTQDSCGMTWGWGQDDGQIYASHVIYVDLPQGQVSFHSLARFAGPDYPGHWDGSHASAKRVIDFCDWVHDGCPAPEALQANQDKEDSNAE